MLQAGWRIVQVQGRWRGTLASRRLHCGRSAPAPRQPPGTTSAPSVVPTGAPSPAMASRYRLMEESDARVIENTEEETLDDRYPLLSDEFEGIDLARGKTGVFEIEDLVNLLQRENANEIYVATVPREINYVDYICVVSGRGKRHVLAVAEFVRRVFKKKCNSRDIIPKIEGKGSDEWMALDLGNIALHIFTDKARALYDLETLWAVGPEYDDQTNKKEDDITELIKNYSTYLKDLKPNN